MEFPNPMLANFVWAGLILVSWLLAVPVILIGLGIEYFFVQKLTGFSVKRSIFADVTMNAISLLLGVLLIPLFSFVWEISVGSLLWELNNQIGSFHLINMTATYILTVLINTVIENFALRNIFKLKKNKASFRWLFLANAFSVGVAFVGFWLYPNGIPK